MKKRAIIKTVLLSIIFLLPIQNSFAKKRILVVVNEDYYLYIMNSLQIYQLCDDISQYEGKNAVYITWPAPTGGTNIEVCLPLWQRLQDEYFTALSQGDVLEGAILIGELPVPMYIGDNHKYNPNDPNYWINHNPFDHIFMDIVDMSTGMPQRYSSPPWAEDMTWPGYYTETYLSPASSPPGPGDNRFDIWISRINATYLNGLREGPFIYDEYETISRYLGRACDRMENPSNVPSRGFAMGGPENHEKLSPPSTLHSEIGTYMLTLQLPWFTEFVYGENSSFNWMSQLLAGPYGCINYGAFNGTLFPTNERNARYCRYNSLPIYLNGAQTTIPVSIDNSDSLGWEWACLYNHSSSLGTAFRSEDFLFNGDFSFGEMGAFWGDGNETKLNDPNFYNGSCHYYDCGQSSPADPYIQGIWKGKKGQWRWPVPPGGGRAYDVYMSYIPDGNNYNQVQVSLIRVSLNDYRLISKFGPFYVDQTTHTDHIGNWERIFRNQQLNNDETVIVSLDQVNGFSGRVIADAIHFVGTADLDNPIYNNPEYYVDDDEPSSYANNPTSIFTTKGFFTSDGIDRNYEDMGEEPGGGGVSKSQFFMAAACGLGDWTYTNSLSGGNGQLDKCVGNLYALGHNGLIYFGASISDEAYDDKSSFTNALAGGLDFGEAYLAKSNAEFSSITMKHWVLLGAGSLRAQPYVQFGAETIKNQTIDSWYGNYSYSPLLLKNVTITGSGTAEIYSTHDNSESPKCSHSEIILRPETHLCTPQGSNYIDLWAQ